MTRILAYVLASGMVLAGTFGAAAQQQGGARTAGGSYVPSTHSAGCAGVLCDGNDPERAVGAPPPPPCQGLLCSVSPYSMQRPVTAGEVQRLQEEQARANAAAVPAPPPEDTAKGTRRHRGKKAVKAKASKAKSVASRTPDPGAQPPQPQ